MKNEKIKLKIGELVLDFGIYPRTDIDDTHIAYMRDAEQAGVRLPPIIVEKDTRRIVDGVHRYRAWQREYGDEHIVFAIAKTYDSEKELFLDAVRYNNHHGRIFTKHDRVHSALLSEKLKIDPEEIASALCLTVEKLGQLRVDRVGKLRVGRAIHQVPLKRTIQHMSGKTLTKAQGEANDHLSGMNQGFYINQLLLLINNDLVNLQDKNILNKLWELYATLGDLLNIKKEEAVTV